MSDPLFLALPTVQVGAAALAVQFVDNEDVIVRSVVGLSVAAAVVVEFVDEPAHVVESVSIR